MPCSVHQILHWKYHNIEWLCKCGVYSGLPFCPAVTRLSFDSPGRAVYSLYALLGRTNDLEAKPQSFASAQCPRLGGRLSMFPLAEDLVSEIQKAGMTPGGASVAGAFEFLSPRGAGSINRVLRGLGVQPAAGIEELELVGLFRHRSLDERVQDAG